MINIITGPEVVLVSVLNMILRLLSGYQKYPSLLPLLRIKKLQRRLMRREKTSYLIDSTCFDASEIPDLVKV